MREYAQTAAVSVDPTPTIYPSVAFYDPISYHQGSVWPLLTGWLAVAEYRAGQPLAGEAALRCIGPMNGAARPSPPMPARRRRVSIDRPCGTGHRQETGNQAALGLPRCLPSRISSSSSKRAR